MVKPIKRFPYCYQSKGFTLVEVMVTVAIATILFIMVFDFFSQSIKIQDFVSEQNQAVSDARKGMSTFTKELREATYADTGAFPLAEASENSLIFYSDIDTDINIERIHYYLEEAILYKGVLEPSGSPLDYTGEETVTVISYSVYNEANPLFTYYADDYPEDATALTYPADLSLITLIKMHLAVNVDPENVPETFTLDVFAQVRNLKDNL